MDSLRGTERTWMAKLLKAFNAGDLCQFEDLRPFWEQQVIYHSLFCILQNCANF
ncbi:hypothetical protein GBAR_LOCUS24781 [Geodia barretti]|uniref:Uncharacterized protein n=1 Tax=Geodia barretti TaxID=519541 RepID=A0AA35TCM5_GEOBA|nr:hypothetical protein GBAR_LOCUS24781 [Geodia barretti]